MWTRLAAAGFFCAPSIIASVLFLADAEVKALACAGAPGVRAGVVGALQARTPPARSTTAAVTA
jgi:hypothetical protein